MLQDGLYINGQQIELAEGSVIALTLQVNNIAELSNRQANYSNQFKAKRTRNNDIALDDPGYVQSESIIPYRKNSARYIKDGDMLIDNGYAIVDKSDTFYNIVLYSGNVNFFDLLEGKNITDLDLSAFNHTYNFASVTGSRTNTYINGYKYPIIDYGKLKNTDRKVKTSNLKPATFVRALLDRIATEAGFVFNYSAFIADKINKLLVAFTNKAFAIPDALRANMLWDVETGSDIISPTIALPFQNEQSVTIGNTTYITPAQFHGTFAQNTYPFDTAISDPGNVFNLVNHSAIINFASRQRYHFKNHLKITVFGGNMTPPLNNNQYSSRITILTKIQNNGNTISGGLNTQIINFSSAPSISGTDYELDIDFFSNWVNESLGWNIKAQQFVIIGYVNANSVIPTGSDDGSFKVVCSLEEFNNEVDADITYDVSTVALNTVLPDISQKDLIRNIAYQTAGIFATSSFHKKVYFRSFQDIILNMPYAKQWSDKIYFNHNSKSDAKNPQTEYRIGSYSQKNNFNYKVDDNDEEVKSASPGLGNGNMIVDDETLPAESTIIEMSFAPTLMEKKLQDLDIALIRKMSELAPTDELTIETQPRILLDDTQNISGADINYFDDLSNTLDTTSDIPLCYFLLIAKSLNLGYNNSLLDNCYPGIASVLNRTKKVTAFFKLDSIDIIALDEIDEQTGELGWFIPVYLRQFSAYFYVNKIMNWKSDDTLTRVELIRL